MKFLKGFSVLITLIIYFCGAITFALLIPRGIHQRRMLIHWMHRFSKLLLQILDVEYWVEYKAQVDSVPGTLYVANHVSYLDVLILSSQFPAVFVTSVEVEKSPILGWLAKSSGAYFVERRDRSTLRRDIREIRELLQQGLHVVLFPEGTTSDGTHILPFKGALLEAIVNSPFEVKPLCLNYRWCDGEVVNIKHQDTLFYFGEMNLWKQLGALLGVTQVLAELIVLPPLASHFKKCRTVAARTARDLITSVFKPITAVLVFGLCLQGAAIGQLSPQELVREGDRAFKKRNSKSELLVALDFYQRARQDPQVAVEASWKYSMALQSFASRFVEEEEIQENLFKEGAEVAKSAAERDPDCGPCEFWTAIHMAQYGEQVGIFKMLGSLSEILARLEKAAKLDPAHAMAGPYRILGTIYQKLPGIIGGDNDKAVGYYEKAIAITPLEPINYLALAKLKQEDGEIVLAKQLALQGIRLAEHNPISLESRESLQELGQIIH